jgi:hypothetical protein
MINKEVFIYKLTQKGFTKKAAEEAYKGVMKKEGKTSCKSSNPGPSSMIRTSASDKDLAAKKKKKKPSVDTMQKKAFDIGFADALRLFASADNETETN